MVNYGTNNNHPCCETNNHGEPCRIKGTYEHESKHYCHMHFPGNKDSGKAYVLPYRQKCVLSLKRFVEYCELTGL